MLSVFKLFKAEIRKTSSYVIVKNEDGKVYDVKHVDAENRDSWSRVMFMITADRDTGHYHCQCRIYEHFGIICCHIMLVMVQTGLLEIPDCHIMKRWTIKAREGWLSENALGDFSVQAAVSRTIRHKNLYMNGLDLVSVGEYDDTTAGLAVKYINIAKKKISEYKATINRTCQIGYNLGTSVNLNNSAELERSGDSLETPSDGMRIFDRVKNFGIDVSSIKAPIVKTKLGRPTNKRFLSHFDANIKNKGSGCCKNKKSCSRWQDRCTSNKVLQLLQVPASRYKNMPSETIRRTSTSKKTKKSAAADFVF